MSTTVLYQDFNSEKTLSLSNLKSCWYEEQCVSHLYDYFDLAQHAFSDKRILYILPICASTPASDLASLFNYLTNLQGQMPELTVSSVGEYLRG
jgi:hypothetical protein